MDATQIIQFLANYGYWVLLPLMIIEGPIVTLIAAFMATLGIFNIFVVLALSVLGDVIGDVALYAAGRRWGMRFVQTIGRHIGISENLVRRMESFFGRHGGKTIFAVKSTTGLCWATFVAAGIVHMRFGKFLWYATLGGVAWSAFLVFLGFFFGAFYAQIADTIAAAGWIVFGAAVIVVGSIAIYKKRQSALFLRKRS